MRIHQKRNVGLPKGFSDGRHSSGIEGCQGFVSQNQVQITSIVAASVDPASIGPDFHTRNVLSEQRFYYGPVFFGEV